MSSTGLAIITTPHTVLEDIFDCLTLSQCEAVFDFMESRLDSWTSVRQHLDHLP